MLCKNILKYLIKNEIQFTLLLKYNKNQKIIINLFIDIVLIIIHFLSKELINYSNLDTYISFY